MIEQNEATAQQPILLYAIFVIILTWGIVVAVQNYQGFIFLDNKYIKALKHKIGDIMPVNTAWYYGYHLMIYGSTGGGKSTFVEHLLYQILRHNHNAKFIIINPHFRKGEYGLEDCIGAGRDYSNVEEKMPTVIDILTTRYNTYYNDKTATFDDLYIIIEELPAIISNTKKGVISGAIKQLINEGRKVNIWIIIVTQSKLVKQIGFENASDLLDNFILCKVRKPYVYYTRYNIDGEPQHLQQGYKKVICTVQKGRIYDI